MFYQFSESFIWNSTFIFPFKENKVLCKRSNNTSMFRIGRHSIAGSTYWVPFIGSLFGLKMGNVTETSSNSFLTIFSLLEVLSAKICSIVNFVYFYSFLRSYVP